MQRLLTVKVRSFFILQLKTDMPLCYNQSDRKFTDTKEENMNIIQTLISYFAIAAAFISSLFSWGDVTMIPFKIIVFFL